MKKLLIAVALLGLAGCGNAEQAQQVQVKPVDEKPVSYIITCAHDWVPGTLTNRELIGFDFLGDGNIYRIDTVDGVTAYVPANDCYVSKIKQEG